MTVILQRTLFGLACAVAGLDLVWGAAAGFHFDHGAYFNLGLLALALFAGAAVYQFVRPDPRLAAMLFGSGFLCLFSAGASVLNYFLLTIAGPRIDAPLAAIDRAIGFYWPAAMTRMAEHPLLNTVLLAAYSSMLPQVALLIIVLSRNASHQSVYRFCLAVAAGALICMALWTVAPSFGAFSVYDLPRSAANLPLALDQDYANALVALLKNGPGYISPQNAKGLIGFPSYHVVLALLVIAYTRAIPALRWPALVLNLVVLIATPLQGGHHLVDVLGGFPVAGLAIVLAAQFKESARPEARAAPIPPPLVTGEPAFPAAGQA